MPFATNGGTRIFYDVAGDGPAMVMLHANPCDHRMWMYQISHFSRRFRVIAPDMRGYGRTDKVTTPYDFDALVGDVLTVCEAEKVTSGVIAGASLGSKIAFQLVADYPDLFQAQIQVGGNAFRGTSYDGRITGYEAADPDVTNYRRGHLKELFAPDFSETPRGRYLSGVILEDSAQLSGKAIATLFHSFDDVDLVSDVPKISIPTLIVNGAHDNSLEGGRRTAGLIPGAKHAVIEDAGHLCILENPATFDGLCEIFLEENQLLP